MFLRAGSSTCLIFMDFLPFKRIGISCFVGPMTMVSTEPLFQETWWALWNTILIRFSCLLSSFFSWKLKQGEDAASQGQAGGNLDKEQWLPEHLEHLPSGPAMSSGCPQDPHAGSWAAAAWISFTCLCLVMHFFYLQVSRKQREGIQKKGRWCPQACIEGTLFWKIRTFRNLYLTFYGMGKGQCDPGSTDTFLNS